MIQIVQARYSRDSTGTYLDIDVKLPNSINNYDDCYDYLMEYGAKKLENFQLEGFETPEDWEDRSLEDCWDDEDSCDFI